MSGVKANTAHFLEEAYGGAYPSGKLREELPIIPEATEETEELFDVRRLWHSCEGGNFVVIGTNAVGGDNMA